MFLGRFCLLLLSIAIILHRTTSQQSILGPAEHPIPDLWNFSSEISFMLNSLLDTCFEEDLAGAAFPSKRQKWPFSLVDNNQPINGRTNTPLPLCITLIVPLASPIENHLAVKWSEISAENCGKLWSKSILSFPRFWPSESPSVLFHPKGRKTFSRKAETLALKKDPC